MLITTITRKLRRESRSRCLSCTPRLKPNPSIGPMTGDMSMAPIMTGMELTFKPTEAMIMAHAKMKTLGPLKYTFLLMDCLALSRSTKSEKFRRDLKKLVNLFAMWQI